VSEKQEIEFVDGLIVKAPNEKAPSFVKAQISIKVEDLGKWLREKYKAGNEWVNLDVKEAKSGRWYAAVSTFKPKENNPTKGRQDMRAKPSSEDPDIPFAPIRKLESSLK
jgi:hypothetical protein